MTSGRREGMIYRLLAMPIFCWMVVTGGISETAPSSLRGLTDDVEIGSCPRCDMIFSMVQTTPSGERVQHVDMQERGVVFRVDAVFKNVFDHRGKIDEICASLALCFPSFFATLCSTDPISIERRYH